MITQSVFPTKSRKKIAQDYISGEPNLDHFSHTRVVYFISISIIFLKSILQLLFMFLCKNKHTYGVIYFSYKKKARKSIFFKKNLEHFSIGFTHDSFSPSEKN